MDWEAVLVGAAVDAAVAVVAAVVELPAEVRWPAFAAVAGAGLLGGYLAGRLAGGSWRVRRRHGLAAGVLGGAAFAGAVWWSLQPAAANGALWAVNYALATGAAWVPPDLLVRYDAAIGVATALALGATYAVEGAVAGGAAPGGDAEEVTVRE